MRFILALSLVIGIGSLAGSQDPKPPAPPTPPAPTPSPTPPAPKSPSVSLPNIIQVLVGRNAHIAITSSDNTPANWSVVSFGKLGEDYDVVEELKRDAPASTVNLLFSAYTPGTYWVVASHGKGSAHQQCKIVAALPVPPKPPEPPPTPVDNTLLTKLQTAYTTDAGAIEQKVAWKGSLLSIYQAMPAHIASLKAGSTNQDLISDLKAAVESVVPAKTSLANVRGVVRDNLEALFGTELAAALDKAKATAAFTAIAAALGAVK